MAIFYGSKQNSPDRDAWQKDLDRDIRLNSDRDALLRARGVVGVVRNDLISTGPDVHGSVSLILMADGSVRWEKE